MLKTISPYLALPKAFEQSENNFWDDEYISQLLLQAHLNPDFEGASRNPLLIDKSVAWISQLVPPSRFPKLLHAGCGPGLYAERFAKVSYQVTGIDFSQRSIAYARDSAQKQGLDIAYHYQNYLELNTQNVFDAATLIYCDYGALSPTHRQVLMKNIYAALKQGGQFLLDVFSTEKYNTFAEEQTWEHCPHGGFWSEQEYAALNKNHKYPDHITLEQTIVITEQKVQNYWIWNQCFSKESLMKEVQEAGFKVCTIFDDITGAELTGKAQTLAILLEK